MPPFLVFFVQRTILIPPPLHPPTPWAQPNPQFTWLEAIEKASKIKDGEVKGKPDLGPYWEALNLDPASNPTLKQIDRAYKKAALRAHPDKGGDADTFKQVTDAYEIITSTIDEAEQEKKYEHGESEGRGEEQRRRR